MDLVVVPIAQKYIDFGPKHKKTKEKEHNHHFNDLFSLWSVITKRTKS